MRKLLCVSTGFCLACIFCAYIFSSPWLILPGVLLLLLSGLAFLCRVDGRVLALALCVLGAGLGMIWSSVYGLVYLSPVKALDGERISITATALEAPKVTDYGSSVEARIHYDGKNYRALLYLDEAPALSAGDRVTGTFRLGYTGAEGSKPSVHRSGTGLFLVGYQTGAIAIEPANGFSLRHFPARLRSAILNRIAQLFPHDTAAFAKALLLGDTADMDYETETALTLSGIIHVVSVSGLHVSILFSLMYMTLGRKRLLTPLVGIGLLVMVAAVTGFSASVVRSCLMNGLMLLALMAEREYDPLTALGFALLVMLGINPLAITSIGLQLSAASVLGIHLLAEPVADWLRSRGFWAEAKRKTILFRLREWFSTTIGVSLAATVATAPLTALHFGSVSLVGWLTNLAVLWLINGIFVAIMVCVLLGSLWLAAGKWLAWVIAWGIRFALWVARLLGGFPLAAVYTESPYIVLWLLAVYGMLALFFLTKRKKKLQLCLCTLLSLAVAVGLSWLEPRLEDFRLTALDVGQGQCVIYQSDGRIYMVDCGGSYDAGAADKAAANLHSQGIFRIDGLVLTHYDRDHVGGVENLLTRLKVDTLYLPEGPEQEAWYEKYAALEACSIVTVEKDLEIAWEGSYMQVLSLGEMETSNESSLSVLFHKENCDILITGDLPRLGERALVYNKRLPKLDVLVVGHHGADSSTDEFLLEQTRPTVAIISAGRYNGYGHPHTRVLERLQRFGCEILRTDLEGTIIIKR